ncbi:MAG: GNAT family N-acetyltransferase [Crocinitomicaceae bacterium]
MDLKIRTPENEEEWEDYYDLRYRILREPLNQPRGSERNEGDETGIHFALYVEGQLKAIARLDEHALDTAQTRFVAVETEEQGKGYGKLIMYAVEQEASDKEYAKMILHARDYAMDFYLNLGYELVEPSYKLFDVLQHFLMEKEL